MKFTVFGLALVTSMAASSLGSQSSYQEKACQEVVTTSFAKLLKTYPYELSAMARLKQSILERFMLLSDEQRQQIISFDAQMSTVPVGYRKLDYYIPVETKSVIQNLIAEAKARASSNTLEDPINRVSAYPMLTTNDTVTDRKFRFVIKLSVTSRDSDGQRQAEFADTFSLLQQDTALYIPDERFVPKDYRNLMICDFQPEGRGQKGCAFDYLLNYFYSQPAGYLHNCPQRLQNQVVERFSRPIKAN